MSNELPTFIVKPGDPGFVEGFYPPAVPGSGWTDYIDEAGLVVRVRAASPAQTMYVGYTPALPGAGRFSIEALIPGDVGTTRGARYYIVSHPGGRRRETEVLVDQSYYHDTWVPLGLYDLDPALPESGRVNLIDATSDNGPATIDFGALGWRHAPGADEHNELPVGNPVDRPAGGFDPPVGTAVERAGDLVWPRTWVDVNPIGHRYSMGFHTGADLNMRDNRDAHAPVCAAADGVVLTAGRLAGTWGLVIVIDHGALDDRHRVYARYAHLENLQVNVGDSVMRGQKIAQVGQFAPGNYHLHFDVSTTTILRDHPADWPGFDEDRVWANYTDPLAFVKAHRPPPA
jgi:Peptidase family M23